MKTEVIFILDKSGSMQKIKDDAIGGYNAFIGEQKKIEDDTKFTLVLFDSGYQKVYESININDVKDLTDGEYIPSSMTALYDAIGITVENTIEKIKNQPEEEKIERVLCVILTDGEENRSRKYTKEAIFNIIDEQKKNDWEFLFLGANQDSFKNAGAISVSTDNAYNFSADSEGMKMSYANLSSATAMYRMSTSSSDNTLMKKAKSLSKEDREKLFVGKKK